jgi:hypothetical protein
LNQDLKESPAMGAGSWSKAAIILVCLGETWFPPFVLEIIIGSPQCDAHPHWIMVLWLLNLCIYFVLKQWGATEDVSWRVFPSGLWGENEAAKVIQWKTRQPQVDGEMLSYHCCQF